MDFNILEVELIYYKSGTVNLVSLNGSTFYIDSPTENDSSVYKIIVNSEFSKNIQVGVYANDENITQLYRGNAELPNKLVTDAFTINFTINN